MVLDLTGLIKIKIENTPQRERDSYAAIICV
jgi:hypothetical protein